MSGNTSSAGETVLLGRRLLLARAVWVAVAACTLTVFVGSLPPVFLVLQTPCTAALCLSRQLSPAQAHTLQQALGLSLHDYAILVLVLLLLTSSVWFASGFFLFWRKSDNWMVLLVALAFVIQTVTGPYSPSRELALSHSLWQGPAQVLNPLGTLLGFLEFALFPTGRFVPRWTRWLLLGSVVIYALTSLIPLGPLASYLLGTWSFFGVALLLVAGQIYRYLRVSTLVERQQTKWVVFSLALLLLGLVGLGLPSVVFPALLQPSSLYNQALYLVSICLIPLSAVGFGVALLRYRLWDIDTLINKALVYGLLTALLGAIYAGLILGLESLAGLFGGTAAQNPLVLVISTLVIAVLVLPVRRRIQSMIDRRFYRRKYDAEKTLAAFSATLRQETDLEQIREQLLSVVQETMQPAHVSLWLRSPEHPARLQQAEEESDEPSINIHSDDA